MNSGQKSLIKQYKIHPIKKMGQNFLIDKKALKKIVDAAEIKPKDTILEIGPGLGALTVNLVKKAEKIIAVEKDPRMMEILKTTLKDYKNLKIINKDILKFNAKYEIQDTKYKIIGNLPYYITAPIIRKFLETEKAPKLMVLTVQKEVGQRICAMAPKMNLLAVSVQFYAKPEIIGYISKKSFWPQPKVDAAIIKITPHIINNYTPDELLIKGFFKIVKAGFSQPRKQLINNFSKKMNLSRGKTEKWLLENNIRPSQRAESLKINDWIKLAENMP